MAEAMRTDLLARVAAAARATATPFYFYDLSVMTDRGRLLQRALPTGSHLLYSAKANPHPRVLRCALDAGCGLELASLGELDRALEAGADGSCVLLVGPAKSDAFLQRALSEGVTRVAVESAGEASRLESAAQSLDVRQVDVLIRLSLAGARGSLRMSQRQFGMGIAEAARCRELIDACDRLSFAGWHGYLASQLLDAADVAHNAQVVLEAAEALDAADPATSHVVDVGGGFGIPYLTSDEPLDIEDLREGLAAVAAAHPQWRLEFESGRFLAGPMGMLATRVVDVKTVDGKPFVLVDGGTNASGVFGGPNAVRPLRHTTLHDGVAVIDRSADPADICGPLCTPMDRLASRVPCAADIGDLVVWDNMGAYGLSAAPTGFLSFDPPPELFA